MQEAIFCSTTYALDSIVWPDMQNLALLLAAQIVLEWCSFAPKHQEALPVANET